jgi:hypothetical protein
MDNDSITTFIFTHWFYLPQLLIFSAGLGIAITRYSKHPTVSILSGLGFTLMLLQTLASIAVTFYLSKARASGTSLSQIAVTTGIVQAINYIAFIAAWVFIIVAIFFAHRPSATLSDTPTHNI